MVQTRSVRKGCVCAILVFKVTDTTAKVCGTKCSFCYQCPYLSKSLFSFTFTDVNECASPDTNGCDRNALCTNIEGSYICRCLKGYQGDGRFCAGKDIHQP